MCLKRSWSDFDPQPYYLLYGEDQNHEMSFKGKALQAVVDSWCKIQVITETPPFCYGLVVEFKNNGSDTLDVRVRNIAKPD